MIKKQKRMRHAHTYLYAACFLMLPAIGIKAQGMLVQQGAYLCAKGNASVVASKCSITGGGSVNLTDATLFIVNGNDVQLGASNGFHVGELNINKSAGKVLLVTDASIGKGVTFQKGLLDLNAHNLVLDSTAIINGENETTRVVGANGGEVIITRTLNKPQNINLGNLGVTITSSKNLGLVTIKRGHRSQNGSTAFNKSILRYYDVVPQNNAQLGATVTFHYLDVELNGIDEPAAAVFKSNNNGAAWTNINAGAPDVNLNSIQKQNLPTLSLFTIANPATNFTSAPQVKTITKEIATTAELKAWPLPATGPLHLQLYGKYESSQAFIYDAAGKLMQQVTLTQGMPATIAHLAPGVYFIKTSIASVNTLKIVAQ